MRLQGLVKVSFSSCVIVVFLLVYLCCIREKGKVYKIERLVRSFELRLLIKGMLKEEQFFDSTQLFYSYRILWHILDTTVR